MDSTSTLLNVVLKSWLTWIVITIERVVINTHLPYAAHELGHRHDYIQ